MTASKKKADVDLENRCTLFTFHRFRKAAHLRIINQDYHVAFNMSRTESSWYTRLVTCVDLTDSYVLLKKTKLAAVWWTPGRQVTHIVSLSFELCEMIRELNNVR